MSAFWHLADDLGRTMTRVDPPIPANTYHDSFGNFCHVIRAPAGRLTMSTDFLVHDNGQPDAMSGRFFILVGSEA